VGRVNVMLGKGIFRGVVGVERATVEDVWFEGLESGSVAVVAVRVWEAATVTAGCAGGGVRAMTPVLGAVGGAPWTRA
jgi:hypothetical protein